MSGAEPLAPVPMRVRVRVPCSTSNLGPGFDQLGLALGLFLEASVTWDPSGPPSVRHQGPNGWPPAGEDLVLAALFDTLPELREGTLSVAISSEIPIARGLGSSGAAVAAGLAVAQALAGTRESDARLLARGIRLEGHPDNLTASLFGGLTLCVPDESGPTWFHVPVHPSLGFAVARPDQPFPTATARAALPRTVPLADAVENARRLPLLLEGLRTGDGEWIDRGCRDRLHEPYRLPHLPGSSDAFAAARHAGAYAATLSGSGSALIAIGPKRLAPAIAEAMATRIAQARGHATGRALDVVTERARAIVEE
jgi:homoserine kinase